VEKLIADSTLKTKISFYPVNTIIELSRSLLIERRIIRPELEQTQLPISAVVFTGEEAFFTLNDIDHLRFHSVVSGREVEYAWEKVKTLGKELTAQFEFATTEKLGYLTSSPTNVGTGLRVSFFCHLPALVISDKLDDLLKTIFPAGIIVRGFLGEENRSLGNIFQICNQITLGLNEEEILQRTDLVVQEVVKEEREARAKIMHQLEPLAIDRVRRSYAVLTHAYLLDVLEFFNFISAIRFGLDLGWIRGINRYELNKLLLYMQPAHLLCKYQLKEPSHIELDRLRAAVVKESLKNAKLIC
jgi:protein arginine kinase